MSSMVPDVIGKAVPLSIILKGARLQLHNQ